MVPSGESMKSTPVVKFDQTGVFASLSMMYLKKWAIATRIAPASSNK
jgi:hypothetical protein